MTIYLKFEMFQDARPIREPTSKDHTKMKFKINEIYLMGNFIEY